MELLTLQNEDTPANLAYLIDRLDELQAIDDIKKEAEHSLEWVAIEVD